MDIFFPSHEGQVFWWGQCITPNPISQLMKQGACYRDPPVPGSGPGGPPHVATPARALVLGRSPSLGLQDAWDMTEPALGEPLIFEKERAGDGAKRNVILVLSSGQLGAHVPDSRH